MANYIIFLSEKKTKSFNNVCGLKLRQTNKKHLLQINNLKMVLFNEVNNFFEKNKIILKNNLLYDNLYIKIHGNYYCEENEYLKCIIEYYFEIYSIILSKFGLHKITFKCSNNQVKDIGFGIDVGVQQVGLHNNFRQCNSLDQLYTYTGEFEMKKSDYYNLELYSNYSKEKRIFELKKICKNYSDKFVYMIDNEIFQSIVFQRIDEYLTNREVVHNISVSDIIELGGSISANINIFDIDFGANFTYSSKNDNNITYSFEFYPIELLQPDIEEENIISSTPIETKLNQGIESPKFYMSTTNVIYSGPWPTNCFKINQYNNIRHFNEAIKKSKECINKDPVNNIIEIVEHIDFTPFPVHTYKVIVWQIKSSRCGIKIDNGKRYLYFDKNNFRDSNFIYNELRNVNFE